MFLFYLFSDNILIKKDSAVKLLLNSKSIEIYAVKMSSSTSLFPGNDEEDTERPEPNPTNPQLNLKVRRKVLVGISNDT